ncbi:NopRA1 domain-containing protein, partial [Haematococcus lacustris]
MAGGADPAALLPFTLCCLRGGLLEVWLLLHWGLLALSLRCLAAPDLLLRAMAYEALGLFSALLESPAAPASVNVQPDGLHPSHVKHDFRERAQLAALLTYARNSVQRPLQRLPHCLALWLAEASCALARGPVSPGFALVSKALLLKEDLDLQQLPRTLLRGLASGTPSAAAEQTWSVALLVAGLQ